MLLHDLFQSTILNYVMLFLAFVLIGNVNAETSKTLNMEADNGKTPVVVVPEQKSVKKQLKVNVTNEATIDITPTNNSDHHTEKPVIINGTSAIESSGEVLDKKTVTMGTEKTSTTKTSNLQPQHHQHNFDEKLILNDEDDISESLKTGFYFFLILSSGAIVFIVFKIYRLRLSRAERKYGVQGDRSTQELTPLPVSIEDGHSDDEDHTVFEVQRQNIRIL